MELSIKEAEILLRALFALPVQADLQTVLTKGINIDKSIIDLVEKLNQIINPKERTIMEETTTATPVAEETPTTPAAPATETVAPSTEAGAQNTNA